MSCDQEQKVEPVVGPENKAVVTIERTDGGSSTVTEGDVLVYTITSNKMVETAIDFSTLFAAASGASEGDFEITGGTLAPYDLSTTMTITVANDGFPELTEKLEMDISAANWGQNWQLNPSSDVEKVALDVANVNEEGVVTIGLNWPDNHDDLDFYITTSSGANWGGSASATGAIPEINTSLWPSDPDGTYYVLVDPYHLEGKTATNYSIHIGLEDGTVQIFEGVIDTTNPDAYQMEDGLYKLAEIVVAGGVVTATNLAP